MINVVNAYVNYYLVNLSIFASRTHSVGKPVGHVSASSLRGTNNLHHLATSNAIVSCYGVFNLDLWQLVVLHSVLLEQLTFLIVSENLMLRDKLVLSDVYKELLLREKLDLARLQCFQILYKVK